MTANVTAPELARRAQERAFLATLLADVVLTALFVAVAAKGGSLTAFSEAVRGGLLLAAHLYAFSVLRAMHRDRLRRYDFGPAKHESLVWVLLAAAALVGIGWVVARIVAVLAGELVAASPSGLAAAAIVNALALLVNRLGIHAMRAAAGRQLGGTLAAQISAREGIAKIHLYLGVLLTLAALAQDGMIAFAIDLAGAAVVIWLKLERAAIMLRAGLPGLLETSAPVALTARVREALAEALPPGAVAAVNTRCSGLGVEVVVTLAARTDLALETLACARETVLRRLAHAGRPVHLAFRISDATAAEPAAGPDPPPPCPGESPRAY